MWDIGPRETPMIVCLCTGTNDRTVRRLVNEGASTVRDIGQQSGAGTQCGSCCCDLKRMLAQQEPEPTPAAGAESQRMVLRR